MAARATQERTLGSILGLGIGDALGMPVTGWTAVQIADAFGSISEYHPRTFSDGTVLNAGEFSDETEIALCIMETYTSANAELDAELIRARMRFLAKDESRRWMSPETLRSLDDDEEPWYLSPEIDDPEVALRGIPIGMIHAAQTIDAASLYRDVEAVVGLTHKSRVVIDRAVLVATAVARVLAGNDDRSTLIPSLISLAPNDLLSTQLRRLAETLTTTTDLPSIMARVDTGDQALDAITAGIAAFVIGEQFEDAVFAAASAGGAADSRAALAGALSGAHFGAGGIPQLLIDQLEGRIYLTLAAPWFYRTIQLMTGRGISMEVNGR
jgi:ADP-ribosylglycohydrolase